MNKLAEPRWRQLGIPEERFNRVKANAQKWLTHSSHFSGGCMKKTTYTEQMLKELRECEEILEALDQVAIAQCGGLPGMFARLYRELIDFRDRELKDWNADVKDDPRPGYQTIYLCDHAQRPYHADSDGPCEVYTTNSDADGEHVCELCKQRRIDGELNAYLARKGNR